ncbi:DUF167 family protein [Kaarinaea lacus]
MPLLAPEHTFYRWHGEDLLLHILVQPRAGKDEIVGSHGDEWKVRITAPPVDGEANQALIKFFSKIFKVPKAQISLESGESSRHKRVRIKAPKRLPEGISAAR